MAQPPPYQEYDQQRGISNPGYPHQGIVEPTQGYNPPILNQEDFPHQQLATNQGYPQQQGITNPGYSPQQGYNQQQDITNPGVYPQQGNIKQQGTTNPGYYPQQGNMQQQGYNNPGYSPQQGNIQQQGYNNPGYSPQQGNIQQQGYTNPGYTQQGYPQQGNINEPKNQPEHSKMCNSVEELSGFGDKAIRRGFIRKVYGILMCQLLITGGIMAVFMFVKPVKNYVQQNIWIYLACFVVTLACIITMACFKNVRRTSPGNFICLGIFTICESCMLGTVATFYDVDAVILAVGITAAVTLGLTVFAFQTKIDFTVLGGILFTFLLILIIAGIVMAILPFSRWSMIGYASAGALLFSFYIIYDTQMMMGGKHKYSVSPEEYIFAALNLYLDIINLFLYILMIVGGKK